MLFMTDTSIIIDYIIYCSMGNTASIKASKFCKEHTFRMRNLPYLNELTMSTYFYQ